MRRWLFVAIALLCGFARSCVFVEPVCARQSHHRPSISLAKGH
jgi:hypothetical protein